MNGQAVTGYPSGVRRLLPSVPLHRPLFGTRRVIVLPRRGQQ